MKLKQLKDLVFSKSTRAIFFVSAIFVFELIFILPASNILQRNGFLASVLPAVLIDYANEDRTAENLTPLRLNNLLSQAAQMKAEDMARRGYFSHDGPNGEKPWTWLDRVGYDYAYAGENLAVNFFDSKQINDAWMNSPAHKENILKNNFEEIGIGVASGNYEGRSSVFVVQFFASTKEDSRNQKVVMAGKGEKPLAYSLTGSIFSVSLIWEKLSNIFNLKHSTWWQRVVSSPCRTVNTLNSFLLFAVLALFVFKVKDKRCFSKINIVALVLVGVVLLLTIFVLNGGWFSGTI